MKREKDRRKEASKEIETVKRERQRELFLVLTSRIWMAGMLHG
jgi:hypothetical protein